MNEWDSLNLLAPSLRHRQTFPASGPCGYPDRFLVWIHVRNYIVCDASYGALRRTYHATHKIPSTVRTMKEWLVDHGVRVGRTFAAKTSKYRFRVVWMSLLEHWLPQLLHQDVICAAADTECHGPQLGLFLTRDIHSARLALPDAIVVVDQHTADQIIAVTGSAFKHRAWLLVGPATLLNANRQHTAPLQFKNISRDPTLSHREPPLCVSIKCRRGWFSRASQLYLVYGRGYWNK